MKTIIAKILLNIIAVFFILSAIAKLYPIIQFEFLLGSFSIPWGWTPYLARTIISIELILGVILLFQFRLQKVSIPWTMRFLFFMILILIYRRFTAGEDADCGCMGDWWEMTPVQSIIKNLVLIAGLAWVKGNVISQEISPFRRKILWLLILASIVVPYVVEPVYVGVNTTKDDQTAYKLDIPLFYTENQKEKPSVDLENGKHIIAFLSVKCHYCQLAAEKIGIIHKSAPQYPFYLFINGSVENVPLFREKYKIESIPYNRLLMPQFLQLSGPELPAVFFIEDGQVVRKVDFLDLDGGSIEKFMR